LEEAGFVVLAEQAAKMPANIEHSIAILADTNFVCLVAFFSPCKKIKKNETT
jgi:hypothetical protein